MAMNNGNSSGILTNSDGDSKKEKKEDKCKIDINRPLSIHITSGGGRVAQGIAMMNTIEELNREIPTRCVSKGFVGSAATYSAFACKERLAGANTQFLLHPPSKSGVSGQTDDLIVTAENSKRTFQTILDIYYRKSRVADSTDAINATFKDNEYSSAKEIKALGLIDEILE
jgi:ATP-dependent protease ClpP protease subunit